MLIKKIEKYYNDYELGDISAKIFNNAMERLEDEKELLQKQLEVFEKENNKNNIVQKELIDIKFNLKKWLKEYQLLNDNETAKKKLILMQVIKYIEIIPGKEDRVNIVFKISESIYNESNFRLLTTLDTHAIMSETSKKILLNLEKKNTLRLKLK